MSTSKHIDKICIASIALMLAITVLFMFGEKLGISVVASAMPYESSLFDTSRVHSIDIVMNDWDSFIEGCESEEYSSCTVVIDGEKYGNVAIRAKGNTSLSTVSSLGSDRYSFKLEFDHYNDGLSCDGLDKLCLNNLIQDNTMMKDYIVYRMMDEFGVDTPLCSFAYLTVNGEDWGLYLAVEGVEDSFLERNYGSDYGELYKPDSLSFGGGRGNGMDFNMDDFDFSEISSSADGNFINPFGQDADSTFNPFSQGSSGTTPVIPGDQNGGLQSMPDVSGFSDFDISGISKTGSSASSFDFENVSSGGNLSFNIGMGTDDVKLKYIDDDPDSYSNIFSTAKTNVTEADEKRLIKALKNLSSYEDLENTVDIDEVIRYFVIHNFVCNGDSYTGSMIHNYYLYEEDGQLSMIPWDYNLAFGTFQGGDASGTVNTSIDSPVSGGNSDDRPMLGWIFSSEEYTEKYHELFAEFIEEWFESGKLSAMIDETADMIRPYVEKDPTKFCTEEEFEKGVTALKEFVNLRAEAVSRQLAGDSTAVDTGSLNLSDMGTMNNSIGGGTVMPSDRNQSENAGSDPSAAGSSGIGDNTQPIPETDSKAVKDNDFPEGSAAEIYETGSSAELNPGDPSVPEMTDIGSFDPGSFDPGSAGGDITPGDMPDTGSSGTVPDSVFDPGSAGSSGMPSMNDIIGGGQSLPGGNASVPGNALNWILVAVSVAVLAAGILIAVKKKY